MISQVKFFPERKIDKKKFFPQLWIPGSDFLSSALCKKFPLQKGDFLFKRCFQEPYT